jgi:predicted SprT family Zn-dependent metalloprotease
MNTLNDVEELAIDLMSTLFTFKDYRGEERTLSASHLGYDFRFDNAKRRNGRVNYTLKFISLSKPKAKVNLHQIDGPIKNTILHEIAHAFSYHIYGHSGRGHCDKWRSIAIQIGCDGSRCSSGYEAPKSKYTLVCDDCGKESPMHRKPKRRKSCGDCDTKFNPKYELKVVQNY